MALAAGVRLGGYQIVAPIGAGGMGEVYRARDTALQRDVAIKVLPDLFARDPERLARFEREARLLAALNHPNIAQIYGVEAGALVMELVDGEDLAARLARGPLALDEAVTIARQIADALEAAHEQGIVHRDLKPANLKLRPDGAVKVLDFGLARETGPAATGAALDNSPTVTSPLMLSATGVILGTAAYMAPEQTKGRAVDKRADVWAFGCVLFEMLSGRRPFDGENVIDLMAAIVKDEPAWARLPAATPPEVRVLLRRCLEKDPKQRLRDIGEARIALALPFGPAAEPRAAAAGPRRWLPIISLNIAAGAVIAAFLFRPAPSSTPAWATGTVAFTVPIGAAQPAVSADGGRLAWTGPGSDGRTRVWTRALGDSTAHEVAGTDGAELPFFAPDGHNVAFFAEGALKRVDLSSGIAQALTSAPAVPLGGTWGAGGDILYSDRFGINRIASSGGTSTLVAPIDRARHENSLRFPQFLPDGRHFLYVARSGRPEENGAYLGTLDGPPERLFATMSRVLYAPPGYVLFLKGDTLFAQRFDVASRRLDGDAVAIASGVAANATSVGGGFDVSLNGVLAYAAAAPPSLATLHWTDRAGASLGTVGEPRPFDQFRIAPDGHRIAAAIRDDTRGSRSIWVLDAGRAPARLTFADTHDWFPGWSPDGVRIAFASYRDGPLNIYVKNASGAGADTPLVVSDLQKETNDWSPDARFIVYREVRAGARGEKGDLVVSETRPGGARIDITRTAGNERFARFSGDGRWIAYMSDETGRPEVFVQPFPPTGAKWQVSVGGGDEPAWRHDGRELFFVDPRGMLNAVAVDAGSAFVAAEPQVLFNAGPPLGPGWAPRYDVAPDGQRFLVAVPVPAPPRAPATVILNWQRLLGR